MESMSYIEGQDTRHDTQTSCGEELDSKQGGPSLHAKHQDIEQDISETNTEGQDREINTPTVYTAVQDSESNTFTTNTGYQNDESNTSTTDIGDQGIIQKGRLVTYSREKKDEFLEKLREQNQHLPYIKRHSKRSIIHHLADEIQSLLDKGYNYKQVADTLKGIGFDIGSGTLQNYLQNERKRRGQ